MKSNCFRVLAVVTCMGMVGVPSVAFAATKQQAMPVQAQVNVNCNFNSSPTMNFGAYDPLAAAPLTGSVVLSVRCTKGATVQIGIYNGNNSANAPAGSNRAMTDGTDYLGYDFFQDNTYATLWTSSGAGLYSYVAASNAPTPINIYGRVPASQNVGNGIYNDSVVVEVIY